MPSKKTVVKKTKKNQYKASSPIATAIWLKNETKLSKEQITEFCGITIYDLENIMYSDKKNISPVNPIKTLELTEEEIERCEKNPKLQLSYNDMGIESYYKKRKKENNQIKRQTKKIDGQ